MVVLFLNFLTLFLIGKITACSYAGGNGSVEGKRLLMQEGERRISRTQSLSRQRKCRPERGLGFR